MTKRRRAPAALTQALAKCEGWGGEPFDFATASALPADLKKIMEEARDAYRRSHFLPGALRLRLSFLNYGLRFSGRRDAKAFRQWWEGEPGTRRRILDLVRWMWQDLELLDNTVVFWRDGERQPTVVPPEKCEYTDPMGVEKLRIYLGWKQQDFEGKSLQEIRRLIGSGGFEPDPTKGEHFLVVKRARVGWGFAHPSIYGLARTLAAHQSLEVADQLWAFLSRTVVRLWKIGHEIRNGPRAGQATWFYSAARARALKEKVENRQGLIDLVANFDTECEFPSPDPKKFDRTRYECLHERFHQWLGPLGLLLTQPQAVSGAMVLFRAEAADKRAELGAALEELLPRVFEIPQPIRVSWSNQCFNDPRIAAELIKHGLSAGPVSQQSFTEEIGLDVEVERERKAREAKLAADPDTMGQVLPVFAPYHAKQPGADNGRPAGTRDAGPREGKP